MVTLQFEHKVQCTVKDTIETRQTIILLQKEKVEETNQAWSVIA